MEQARPRAGNVIYLDPSHGRPAARIIRLTREAIDRRLAGERAGPVEVAAGVIQVDEAALMVAVGRQIRQRRTACGMSQLDLAEVLDCDRSAVCRWETGQRVPTLAHLVALGRALGCAPAALLENDGFAE
jgi:ribosome-binding protein aMBF1 (putative translation factor)